ncbi:pyruvate, phosphate dikinase [Candidatus Peregrinibacteria bacterium]|jgi:pyruvate, orthophosphate dikinase|nr:pyruvate, phosphate dikinase [Candidatus Peregrinibacteria bacterium]MBT4632334.1 pyruvate, phosphate dikinase [Candidatus Peregrinibacteria bacterium]MBT5517132.1 pyruvate, phosphate dikinase [Candidatus Peregrinibacteria bacterium]MBT5824042.1 pyruvate, phosphate dikinase [Candidatus Peregrinibacteria bacterium]
MKHIYSFAEGDKSMKDLLGGKGANLSEMTSLGLPVPFGFTITTETCNYYLEHSEYPSGYFDEFDAHLDELEHKMKKNFGDSRNPLLVSVRSGARVSMPGMMDTVLNLGLNDDTVQGLIEKTGNPRFSYDAYRRFVTMFGNVVLDVGHERFEHALEAAKTKKGIEDDTDMEAEDWKNLVLVFKQIIQEETGKDFPEDPREQLRLAVEAVFKSWNNKRAIAYRNMNNMPHNMGTAVNVQAMVFGNMGGNSGTGVAFTRNPSTGERAFYGEFLCNAQGEDVVAGIRTPQEISELRNVMPAIYDQLYEIQARLEKHYRDMQDIEFTIEKGKLYFLQTRTGKRTAKSAIKIAVEMVNEGMISKNEALMRIDPNKLNILLHPSIDPGAKKDCLAKGLPASPGAAAGKIVFTADEACHMIEEGEKVLLVRKETSPEDIHGMNVAEGILTATGGMTSHAAVVARGMGKPCIAGCKALIIDEEAKTLKIGDRTFGDGDLLTLDGSTGEIFAGEMPTVEPELFPEFDTIMSWADEVRRLQIRTNADTPHDAEVARRFGAEGIGLCRTEHMFFEEDRILNVRKMILARNADQRAEALEKLRPMQVEDFKGIFKVMDNLPVTVRLLDPPLHEFLPDTDEKMAPVAAELGVDVAELKEAVHALHEFNPMLGHRGCRLGITHPEIYEMQVRAIFEAAMAMKNEVKVKVEIEVPLTGHVNELKRVRAMIDQVAAETGAMKDGSSGFEWKVGTMIELPRACVTADEIAKHADFFSFGTNDLTQMTFGFSRDDAGSFLPYYTENEILADNPTETIDQEGVGQLMRMAVKLGRSTKPGLEVGICGEHGGEPRSVMFCHDIELDYVSCSPYRVPVARLAAAQAAL